MMETKERTYKGHKIEAVSEGEGYVVRVPFDSHGAEWAEARCPYFPSIRAAEKGITEGQLALRPLANRIVIADSRPLPLPETV